MDGKTQFWRFKTLYEKESIKKFIEVHKRKKIERDESGTVTGGIINKNIFEAHLNILSKNKMSFIRWDLQIWGQYVSWDRTSVR